MHRLCYRCLLRFHPARFCERFAEEMLSIFDHVEGRALRSKLVADAFISLLRQWSIRPQNWEQKAPAGIPISATAAPAFFTLGEFKVRKSALFCRAAHLINSLPTLISELCVVSAPSGCQDPIRAPRRRPWPPSPLPFCFHTLADSLSSPKKSTPLQSSKSSLFSENTRGMGSTSVSRSSRVTGHQSQVTSWCK